MAESLSDDEIDDLVRRLEAVDMGAWDRAAVDRAAAELGWRLAPEHRRSIADELVFQASFSAGRGFAHSNSSIVRPDDREFESFGYLLAEGNDREMLTRVFQKAREAAERRLHPAPIHGGPGPWLRWRRPNSLLEIERTSRDVVLRLRSTQVVEDDEYRACKWGDRDFAVGAIGVWMSVGRHESLEGMMVPGGFDAGTWSEFQAWLAETLRALTGDMPCLRDDVVMVLSPGDESDRFVQLTIDEEGLLHLEAARRPEDVHTLTALGWEVDAPNDVNPSKDFPAPSGQEVNTAAQLLVRTLRTFGVDLSELRHEAWLTRSDHRLELLGIGVP